MDARRDAAKRLLARAEAGDHEAMDELFDLVYEELREIAHRHRAAWTGEPTLATTDLVHEAYLRLVRGPDGASPSRVAPGEPDRPMGVPGEEAASRGEASPGPGSPETERRWSDRAHFLAVASVAIRRILIDHARQRATVKRGGRQRRLGLGEIASRRRSDAALSEDEAISLITLDEALGGGAVTDRPRRSATGRRDMDRLELLFEKALRLPASRRPDRLDRWCGADEELRAELASLLACAEEADPTLAGLEELVRGGVVRADPERLRRAREEQPGTLAGRFRIVGTLGRGSQCTVYEARDLRLRRPVALKVAPPRGGPGDVHALIEEARSIAALRHPNVGEIHEVSRDEAGRPFLVMPYYGRRTLRTIVTPGGVPLPRAAGLTVQVGRALAYAHGRGIVHGDVKPGNVMLGDDSVARLIDFDIARRLCGGESEERNGAAEARGTLPYMAPERLAGESADHRSDIWSLGILLTELATGSRPFHGDRATEVVEAIVRGELPAWPRPRRGDADGLVSLETIAGRALVKAADARYELAGAMVADLEDWIGAYG